MKNVIIQLYHHGANAIIHAYYRRTGHCRLTRSTETNLFLAIRDSNICLRLYIVAAELGMNALFKGSHKHLQAQASGHTWSAIVVTSVRAAIQVIVLYVVQLPSWQCESVWVPVRSVARARKRDCCTHIIHQYPKTSGLMPLNTSA